MQNTDSRCKIKDLLKALGEGGVGKQADGC